VWVFGLFVSAFVVQGIALFDFVSVCVYGGGVAKEMMSCRIDSDLRVALAGEALSEGRSVANMLERVLADRYRRGAVLVERDSGDAGSVDEGPSRTYRSRTSRDGSEVSVTPISSRSASTEPAVVTERSAAVVDSGPVVQVGEGQASAQGRGEDDRPGRSVTAVPSVVHDVGMETSVRRVGCGFDTPKGTKCKLCGKEHR
jgi:hypothetical protein